MNRTQQIRKLLSKLAGTDNIKEINIGEYQLQDSSIFLNIMDSKYKERDYSCITINFNTEEIEWRAWHESGHNGSSFGEVSGQIDWEHLDTIYDTINDLALEKVIKDKRIEAEKIKQEKLKLAAQKELNELYEK